MTAAADRKMRATSVPGVYKRGNRYVAVLSRHGKQTKRSFRTMAEAKTAKAAHDAGEQPTSRERFEVYAERWLEEYRGRKAGGIGESTRENYRRHMRGYVIPYFRGRKLGDIGPLDVKHFIDHLATVKPVSRRADVERLSKASIGSIMVPLKALLAEAHELELTRTDASKVRVVVQTDQAIKPPKAMTPDQTAAVLGAIPERDRLLFLFLSRTGLRIAEALGLQWQDFEQTDDGPVIAVRRQYYRGKLTEKTKTAAGKRHVAVLPSLAQALMRHRASSEFASAGDPMFPALNGAHQDDHNVRRRLRPAAEAAGVPWVTPHVFRDSLATQLRDAGYDADVIAKVLGHTDEAFTRRVYTHTRAVPRFDDLDLSIARKA